jgi:hypothetical protein
MNKKIYVLFSFMLLIASIAFMAGCGSEATSGGGGGGGVTAGTVFFLMKNSTNETIASSEVWKVSTDGSGLTKVISYDSVGFISYVTGSPNGRYVAIQQLYNVAVYDTQLGTLVTTEGRPNCWSPDGSKLIISKGNFPNTYLYVTNSSLETPQRLTNTTSTTPEIHPVFSPDGTFIVFERQAYGTPRAAIYTINTSSIGGAPTNISPTTEADGYDADITAQNKIIFRITNAGAILGKGIYIMDQNGSNGSRIFNNGSHAIYKPLASEDGQYAYFVYDYDLSPCRHFKINITSGATEDVTPAISGGGLPQYPNVYRYFKKDIFFTYKSVTNSFGQSKSHIVIFNPDGSGILDITPTDYNSLFEDVA